MPQLDLLMNVQHIYILLGLIIIMFGFENTLGLKATLTRFKARKILAKNINNDILENRVESILIKKSIKKYLLK